MIRPSALLLALLFIVIPGTALPQEEKPKQDPPKKDEQDDLKTRAQNLKKEVTETRGMKFKNEVTVGVYSKDELLKFLKKEFERETPKEKVEMWAKIYRHFGLIPKDLDLYQAYLDLFGSSIAGFYHPKTKELYLIRAADGDKESKQMEEMFQQQFGVSMEDVTLVHELNHAAQDQNHELSSLPMDDETNDDMIAAMKGLIEGDASAVGWKWGLKDKYEQIIGLFNDQYKKGGLPGKAARLPVYLRKSLTFPYGHGTDFVNEVLKNANDDFAAIDKAFQEMPLSTEQILHPKKYFGKEKDWPKAVEVKDVDKLAGGWKRIATNVFGEFGVGILLDEFRVGTSRERRKAAEGWGGDRYWAYENDGKVATVWATAWDTKDDAVEFFDLYVKLLEKKYEKATKEAGDTKVTFTGEGGSAVIERKDADVVVLDNVPADQAGKTGDVLSALSKTEFSKLERYKLDFRCPKHEFLKSHKAGKCDICETDLVKDGMKK